jgi:flagellar biosynthesis/type III secretory pathway ATPase
MSLPAFVGSISNEFEYPGVHVTASQSRTTAFAVEQKQSAAASAARVREIDG